MSLEDRAQDHEATLWSMRNDAVRKPVRYCPLDTGYGQQDCTECGDAVGIPRRELGFSICFDCASAAEKSKKQFSR